VLTNVSEESIAFIFRVLPPYLHYPEDGGGMFLQNDGNHLQEYIAS
jgi:hypothetical protein